MGGAHVEAARKIKHSLVLHILMSQCALFAR